MIRGGNVRRRPLRPEIPVGISCLWHTGDPEADKRRWIKEIAYHVALNRPIPQGGRELVADSCVYLARIGILVP